MISFRADQGLLETQLHHIFPRYNILKNSKKETGIKNLHTGVYLEVDVWIPEINLCFEFQDDYHYKAAWYSHTPLHVVLQKDDIKRMKLLNNSQTLIVVPYWWDGTSVSLQGSIRFQRPDLSLLPHTVIPTNPSFVVFDRHKQLMLASFPDPILKECTAWWVGEKWDGVRCYWDVTEKRLYSRLNNKINVYPFVAELYGSVVLDGELWCGRGFFHESQTIISSAWDRFDGSFLRLVCFDEASTRTESEAYEMRYALVLSNVPSDHPSLMLTARFLIDHPESLEATLQSILRGGGEGLILRKQLSRYIPGRSDSLFKLKAQPNDHEALVVEVRRDGLLVLQLPNGFKFSVAQHDCVMSQRVTKGDIVTFSVDLSRHKQYHPLQESAAKDYSAKIIVTRVRTDIGWDDVTQTQTQDIDVSFLSHQFVNVPQSPSHERTLVTRNDPKIGTFPLSRYGQLNPSKPLISTKTHEYKSVQRWRTIRARKEYFDDFAASKAMDPLNPAFWYSVTPRDLIRFRTGYSHIAKYYGRKLPSILMKIYPNIGLKERLFKANFPWKVESERKAYFDQFASSRGMDPLNPEFWYSITPLELGRYRTGIAQIASYYGRRLSSTLLQLYPNIGLQKHLFKVHYPWKFESGRRAYFDEFAASKGMDELNPLFWYTVTPAGLLQYNKGYHHIARYYGGTLSSTLMQLYPNIGLRKRNLKAQNPWKLESGRKAYFDEFAASKGMDPLDPVFWYSVSPRELLGFRQGYKRIASYYGGKLSSVIMHLYPSIGLQRNLFKAQHHWTLESARRSFLDSFAAAKGMDPLNPVFWQSTSPRELRQHKGYKQIASYYGGKLHTMVTKLYHFSTSKM